MSFSVPSLRCKDTLCLIRQLHVIKDIKYACYVPPPPLPFEYILGPSSSTLTDPTSFLVPARSSAWSQLTLCHFPQNICELQTNWYLFESVRQLKLVSSFIRLQKQLSLKLKDKYPRWLKLRMKLIWIQPQDVSDAFTSVKKHIYLVFSSIINHFGVLTEQTSEQNQKDWI